MATKLLERVKSYDKIAMNQGVVLDFPLFEGTGNIIHDVSKYHSNGVITGASWAAGLHGHALDFDPTIPSYVEIPAAHTQLDFTAEAFSIIARIKINDLSTNRQIYCRGVNIEDGYYIGVRTDGAIRFTTAQSGVVQQSYSDAGGIVIDTWYTIGVSRDGASGKIYVAGVDVTETPAVHINPATSARTAKIGIYDTLTINKLDGKIEFLRIFGGVALSEADHLAWHNKLA